MTRLLDPRFVYVPAVATDVAATFRRHGFRPARRAEEDAAKPLPEQEDEVALGVECAWPALAR